MRKRPVIALLTDFGQCDPYVASMKGVIASIAPPARIIDISHEILPQNITQAAYVLWSCYRYFPRGTIFVCVVDPGVGTHRRILCAEAGGFRFLAPDNGLLRLVLESTDATRVVTVENRRLFGKKVSPTFHGRDILAPVAAHLSNGIAVAQLGPRTSPSSAGEPLVKISPARKGRYPGAILHVDHFGNIITNFHLEGELARPLTLRVGRRTITKLARTYLASGRRGPYALAGSTDLLEISVTQGSAARLLHATIGQPLMLEVS